MGGGQDALGLHGRAVSRAGERPEAVSPRAFGDGRSVAVAIHKEDLEDGRDRGLRDVSADALAENVGARRKGDERDEKTNFSRRIAKMRGRN